ncbi:putative BPIFA4P protein [Trachypithecus francoisi]|uniref:putative BPIFA4P protein n=1 Tax=Trachypithecus francoisi TaxID=54180 RepID=UPI00141ADBD6|nr:putative BPIFA4P protein [Trachypithecus francoisi]
MLNVSGLFVLLCGLLASSTAQEVLAGVSSQLLNDLTQGLLRADFLPSLQTIGLQKLLSSAFDGVSGLLNILGPPLTNEIDTVRIQVKNPQLLQVSIESTPQRKEATVRVPFISELIVQLLTLKPFTANMQSDIKVQIRLEKNVGGRYELAFGNCKLLPEAIWIQTGAQLAPAAKFVVANIERNLKNIVAHDLGQKVCTMINKWLYNLEQHVVKELINLVLLQEKYQVTI